VDKGEEVAGSSIVSGCDTTEMLELVEAAFDAISGFVGDGIMWNMDLSRAPGGDDGGHVPGGDRVANIIAVVSFVSNDAPCVDTLDQGDGGFAVMDLASGQHNPQGPSERVGEHVYFGRQSSSRAPQSLILSPPFPVAAC